jgi:hypothetical protein
MNKTPSILLVACLLSSGELTSAAEEPAELRAVRTLGDLGVILRTGDYGRQTPVVELELFLSPVDKISAKQFAPIRQLKSLRKAKLTGAPVNDVYLEHFAGLQNLESIELVDTRITDKSLEILSHLKNLREVTLAFCPDVTDRGVRHLGKLVRLEELTLTDIPGLTGSSLAALQSTTKLRQLDLSWSPVSDPGIAALGKQPALERLVLVECPVGDQSLVALAAMPKLRELALEDTKVTRAGRESLRKTRPNLTIRE